MKHLYKYLIVIIIGIILSIAFTGSHSVQSIDDLGYAVAIGFDVGQTHDLKVTFQFTMPSAGGESASSGAAPCYVDSIEADSIDSAINLLNSVISKEVNLSHCKIIVFSEELASKGIGKEVYSLINKVQLRPNSNVIISTSSAEDYIKSIKPTLENLVAKFYEILPNSSEYTGYTSNVELGDFFDNIVSPSSQPVAILRKYYS